MRKNINKGMKTIIVLCFLLGLTVFAAMAQEDLAGVWHLTEGDTGSAILSAEEVGMEMTLTLSEDGTYSLSGTDMDTVSGTWSQISTSIRLMESTGAVSFLAYEDGRLSIHEGGVQMYFDRETAQKEEADLRTDAALADFSGRWEGVSVTDEVGFIRLNAIGMAMSLDIRDTRVELTMVLEGEKTSGTLEAHYENGAMIVAENETAFTLRLLEDGSMDCEMASAHIRLEKVEEKKAPVAENATLSDMDGVWKAEYALEGENRLSLDVLGVDMQITVFEGQADMVFVQNGETMGMIWEGEWQQGALQPEDGNAPILYLREDGKMSCAWDGITFILEALAPEGKSPVRTDAAIADFDGAWTAVYGTVGGVRLSMEEMGIAMALYIADGRVEVNAISPEGDSSRSMPGTWKDGVLTVIDASDGTLMDIRLHEDGSLSCTVRGTSIWFEKYE